MFPFSRESNDPQPAPDSPARPAAEAHPLDALTGGVFSAATSGERAQRVRDWLASGPTPEQMQEVFKELSAKDKGAARALRERLDELRRAKGQEAVAAEWAAKAQALLQAARLNIADALAWQRDAAKAGAPLSREPLAGLRTQLAQRVKVVEDLQQRVMVQREAAILLAQRIELLSTKPWQDAQAQQVGLAADVAQWRQQAAALLADAQWPSVDLRFPPQMEAAQTQLSAVWDAFGAALAQAQAAAADAAAPLPSVPVWADELRAARGEAPAAAAEADKPARPRIDPEQRAAAHKAVEAGVMLLEQAVTAGHTKNMHSATQALRQSLKTHGRLIDDALEARVHAVLVSAGELEGWQRWSADKLREQLVARAEALLVKRRKKAPAQGAPDAAPAPSQAESGQASATEPTAVPAAPEASASPAAPEQTAPEGQPDTIESAAAGADPASAGAENDAELTARPLPATTLAADEQWVPAMGGRKLQEAIRKLRDEWKAADQGGPPNHALWKRFDRAVSTAHAFVDEWIAGVRAQAAEHKAQREALIDEVRAWAASHADAGEGGDWKAVNRQIHQFAERWRNAGHLSEKQFAELQPRWKEAIHAAALPLENMQKHSTARRQALIQEAEALGAAPQLRIDAVRALQQRWQAEAQAVPLDRKHEQKLWDAFRKPIDEAFNRKSAEREKAQAAMSAHDRAVLEAAKALEAANASGDAQRIRAAMAQLEAATRAQPAPGSEEKPAAAPADGAPEAIEIEATEVPTDAPDAPAEGAAPAPAPKPAKPLVAMRGDDRPGARKAEPAPAGRPGERRPAGRDGRAGDRREGAAGRAGERGARRFDDARGPRRSDEARGPRLGDAAFRAQRDAVEQAQAQLRKLAAQAHGEALTQLLGAWQARQPDQVPGVQELGRGVTPALRNAWTQAIGGGAGAPAAEALLRLEMAAEVPTPAEHLQARRALQLQLLTRRNDPSPAQTWGQDTAAVLAGPHDDATARRLQTALKGLLRK
ncbi:MAG: DUF349 domain-containing protein [Rubrivivax sp.]|uniref:DUF349 domain-containing protein n=1 Tax=Ottowia sp. TaxID=1898956 RepID=UPI00217B661D|nr:DUF349 domain-containing protein [Ottowia sp.]MCC6813510.1 DUF349 domain-containing protein [Rubrivivax sp.]HNR83864.1 DUF349 domain-containing protein [Ottowia sp.]